MWYLIADPRSFNGNPNWVKVGFYKLEFGILLNSLSLMYSIILSTSTLLLTTKAIWFDE